MALSFFASRRLAERLQRESGAMELPEFAETMRRVFPDAVLEYARLGRVITEAERVVAASTPAEPPSVRVGRNALCPCASGRKYKKCCGAN